MPHRYDLPRRSRAFLLLLACCFVVGSAFAQRAMQVEDGAYLGAVAADGREHFYVARQHGVSKYTSEMEEVWSRDVAGAENVAVHGSGSVVVAGDSVLTKLDADGATLWTARLEHGIRSLALDASGNVYVGGYAGARNCGSDPAPGTIEIAKYTQAGTRVWGVAVPSARLECNYNSALGGDPAVAVDAVGTVHVAGHFHGTVDFDPGAGATELTSAGGSDVFVARYTSDGRLGDVFRVGGERDDIARDLAVDALGNRYVAGYMEGDVDFDPGDGEAVRTMEAWADAFVAKYDASGALVWATDIGGDGGGVAYAEATQMTLGSAGEVYLTGIFFDRRQWESPVDFDPGDPVATVPYAGEEDAFLAKYDASGAFEWGMGIGGTWPDRGLDVAVLGSERVVVLGSGCHAVGFQPGPVEVELDGCGLFVGEFAADGPADGDTGTSRDDLADASPARIDVFPNPAARHASVDIVLPLAQRARVTLYDVLGREIAVLHDGIVAAGQAHRLGFDVSGLSGGVYLLRVEGETFAQTQRVVVRR